MSKVLVIGEKGQVALHLGEATRRAKTRLETKTEAWKAILQKRAELDYGNALLVDLTDPDAPGAPTIRKLRSSQPDRPMLIVSHDRARLGALKSLVEELEVDYTFHDDPNEIVYRLERLLQQSRHIRQMQATKAGTTQPPRPLVERLHDPRTGRLDAKRIAEFYAIPLADVARALRVTLPRIHKTPTSQALQPALFVFERIAFALLKLAGSMESARIWLNIPDKQLADMTPMALIREGRGEIVAEMLDDMLLGHPS